MCAPRCRDPAADGWSYECIKLGMGEWVRMDEYMAGGSCRNGFLKFRERDFFGPPPAAVKKDANSNTLVFKDSDPLFVRDTIESVNTKSSLGNYFILELVASVLLLFSSLYVPEFENDFLKQYVSSLTITAVIMTMKDKRYFCPDGTFMVSTIMLFSGAYDVSGERNYVEYSVRVFGQLSGFVIVIAGFVLFNKDITKNGIMTFTYISTNTNISNTFHPELHVNNRIALELFGTFIEAISVSFALMPLLKVTPEKNDDGRYTTKSESLPPKNKDVWFAAASLGLIHYVLERVFRVTMNPFVTVLYIATGGLAGGPEYYFWGCFVAQLFGLFFACMYCHYFQPSPTVLGSLVAEVRCSCESKIIESKP